MSIRLTLLALMELGANSSFQVSLENGLVVYYDARTLPSDLSKETTARFTIQAHDGAASGLDINPHVRGLIATGGTDNFVKLWNVTEEQGATRVKMLTSRNLEVVCTVVSTDGTNYELSVDVFHL